jgi:hypothetical protein
MPAAWLLLPDIVCLCARCAIIAARQTACILYSENSASAEFQPVASHEIVQPQQQELRT